MLEIKKILCPIAGTGETDMVLDAAVTMCKRFDAELTVLYVYPISVLELLKTRPHLVEEDALSAQVSERLESHAEEVLDQARAKVDVKAEFKAVVGQPGPLICTAASEGEFDLVVMGSRRHDALQRILLGTVSEHVLRHSCRPVLVVRNPEQEQK